MSKKKSFSINLRNAAAMSKLRGNVFKEDTTVSTLKAPAMDRGTEQLSSPAMDTGTPELSSPAMKRGTPKLDVDLGKDIHQDLKKKLKKIKDSAY